MRDATTHVELKALCGWTGAWLEAKPKLCLKQMLLSRQHAHKVCSQAVLIQRAARDVSLSEANGVTLQQQQHCPTPMAMGDCRNGNFRDGEVVQTAHNSTLVCIGAIFLFTEKSMTCQKCYVYPSGEQITFEYPGFEAMTVLEKYVLCKRRG